LQEVVKILDEPYADISLIPTYLLSKEISKLYKVAISGDGGDELLFGYEHSNKIPNESITLGMSFIFKMLYKTYPARFGSGNKILSKVNSLETAYKSYFEDIKLLNLLNLSSNYKFDNYFPSNSFNSIKRIMVADYRFYLSEMMLLKIDRASMANSLEIRSPFVDHNLIEYILSSDTNYIDKTNPKAILKNYISSDFNTDFLNRKKMGFSFDMENWIFSNIHTVKEVIQKGNFVHSINSKIVSQLSQRPTRINSHRLWKLFLLELFIESYE
jgi:asparagine synthase (glutamine-hydrolysing)